MLTCTKIIFKFLEHHSWPELFRRIWLITTKRLFERRDLLIVKLTPATLSKLNTTFEMKELTRLDIDQMLTVMYLSRKDLNNRFDHGERCFIVMNDGRIASYFWAQFGVKDLVELHLKIHLKSNQVWFYNAVTVKIMRGKRCYPSIIQHMAKMLEAEGFNEFFIDVEARNIASIHGVKNAGCTPVVNMQMEKLLSKARYKIRIFDKNAWLSLFESIEDIHGTSSIVGNSTCS